MAFQQELEILKIYLLKIALGASVFVCRSEYEQIDLRIQQIYLIHECISNGYMLKFEDYICSE